MMAAVFHGPNNIIVQEVPSADNNNSSSNNNNQASMKVSACAVCGYDARVYRKGHRKVSPPVVLGHELCGEIQNDINIHGSWIKTGSRVALCPLIPCLECAYCQAGEYNLCTNLREIGSTQDGGFAQYVTIPDHIIEIGGLVKVPDSLSDEEAALLEPLACCLNSFLRLSPVSKECPVVIIGDGPIGLLHVQLFKRVAGARVALVGKIQSRMDRAKSMGADEVFSYSDRADADVMDFAGPRGAAIAVISVSNPEAYEFAKRIVGKNAKINVFAGMPSEQQTFMLDANWLHYNQISITGTFSSTPAALQEAAAIAAEKKIDLSTIITHRYPLAAIEQAIGVTERYTGLRAVINRFV